jgi:GWxTD domain-containing protein
MAWGVLALIVSFVACGLDVHPGDVGFSAILGKLSAEKVTFSRRTPEQVKRKRLRERKRHYQELSPSYKNWLNEDVVYLIAPEERAAFLDLNSDVERDEFIEQFWYRRNPKPDSLQNQTKIEHYRRIAFADKHFAAGPSLNLPGWKTDRGKIYILLGPPDRIESRQLDVLPEMKYVSLPVGPGPYPEEVWHYHWVSTLGRGLDVEFVKPGETDDFEIVRSVDAELEQANSRALLEDLYAACGEKNVPAKSEGIQLFICGERTGVVKFKDLEALVTSRIVRNAVKFEFRPEFEPVTSYMSFVRLQVKVDPESLAGARSPGPGRQSVRLFGRFTNPLGRVVETFEDEIPETTAPAGTAERIWPTFHEKCVLRAGTYSLALVVGDSATGNVGTATATIVVPPMNE